jgi:hypothetical protein
VTVDFAYDPVTAIDESSAVGDTAVLFADIRQTMGIPLVTSIWRGLAGMDDMLGFGLDRGEADLRKRRARTRAEACYRRNRPAPAGTPGTDRTCLRRTDGRRYHRCPDRHCRLQSLQRPEPDGIGCLRRVSGNGSGRTAGFQYRWDPANLAALATAAAA